MNKVNFAGFITTQLGSNRNPDPGQLPPMQTESNWPGTPGQLIWLGIPGQFLTMNKVNFDMWHGQN
jgi:hypothetical protein